MNVRTLGLAISLVLGMAGCMTSRSQTRPSGSTETASSGAQGADTASTAGSSQTAASGEQAPSSSSSAQPESQAGSPGAYDPLMKPGPAIKGHASDQIVSGEVGDVSEDSVAIRSSRGDTKVLEIVPETTITIDGMEGSSDFIEEGEPVRASFNELDGRDVAVEIQVGRAPSGRASDVGGPSAPGGSGSSGSSDTGPSDTGSSGAAGSSSGDSSAAPSGSDSGSSDTHPHQHRW